MLQFCHLVMQRILSQYKFLSLPRRVFICVCVSVCVCYQHLIYHPSLTSPTAPAWKRPSGAPLCRLLRGASGQCWPGAGLGCRGRGERWRKAETAPGRHRRPPRHTRNPLALLPPPTPPPTRLGQRARLHPQASLRSVALTWVRFCIFRSKRKNWKLMSRSRGLLPKQAWFISDEMCTWRIDRAIMYCMHVQLCIRYYVLLLETLCLFLLAQSDMSYTLFDQITLWQVCSERIRDGIPPDLEIDFPCRIR